MTSAAPIALRVLVTFLAVVAAVGQLTYLDTLWWGRLGWAAPMTAQLGPSLLTLISAHAVVSAVSGVLAVVLVFHAGASGAAARGLGLALAAWSYLMAYSGTTVLLRPDPGVFRTVFEAHFLVIEMAGLAGLLRFTALFPNELATNGSHGSVTAPSALGPLHSVIAWMLRPASPWITVAVVLAGLWGLTVVMGRSISDAGLSPAMDVFLFAVAALVVFNLRRSWNRSTADEATRLRWLLVALVFLTGALLLLVGGNVLIAVTEWPEPPIPWRPLLMDLGLMGFLVALASSVLYRGPVDPDRLARSVAAYCTVVTAGLFLAACLEALLSGRILAGLSLGTGVGTVIAIVTVVSTHRAMVRWLERAFDQIAPRTSGHTATA